MNEYKKTKAIKAKSATYKLSDSFPTISVSGTPITYTTSANSFVSATGVASTSTGSSNSLTNISSGYVYAPPPYEFSAAFAKFSGEPTNVTLSIEDSAGKTTVQYTYYHITTLTEGSGYMVMTAVDGRVFMVRKTNIVSMELNKVEKKSPFPELKLDDNII